MKLDPANPKLTQYAMGGLNAQEREQIEDQLKYDPESQRYVEEIQALTGALRTELKTEQASQLVQPHETAPLKLNAPRPTRRRRLGILWAAAASVVLASGLGFLTWRNQQTVARHQTDAIALRTPEAQADATKQNVTPQVGQGQGGGVQPFDVVDLNLEFHPSMAETQDSEPRAGVTEKLKFQWESDGSKAGVSPRTEFTAGSKGPGLPDEAKDASTASPEPAQVFLEDRDESKFGLTTTPETGVPGSIGGGTGAINNARYAEKEAAAKALAPFGIPAGGGDRTRELGRLKESETENLGIGSGKPSGGGPAGPKFYAAATAKQQLRDHNFIEADAARPPDNIDGQPNSEDYAKVSDNLFLQAANVPLSTFSIDVDTASYSNIRRFITHRQLPPKDAVRIEEMVNYFPYDYAAPAEKDEAPFASNVEIAGCPWNVEHRLVRVGLKGKVIAEEQRPASNLVFLIDVSGSMADQNKLPLLKESFKLLVQKLSPQDKVTIVVYAGSTGLVLPTTMVGEEVVREVDYESLWREEYEPRINRVGGKELNREQLKAEFAVRVANMVGSAPTGRDTILAALDRLGAGGSTNGGAGIQLAYDQAASAFIKGGTNRVILATDGDFNVGITNRDELTKLIEEKAKSGVFLSVLGFGMGNTKDATMEQLADKGNGNYAYIDTLSEGKKVLVDQMGGTLITIAKDVKIQVEFNPAKVSSYRLIGYENRMLAKEDFNNDKKDAGEIGAGHTVTALYEVVPMGAGDAGHPTTQPSIDPLRYQTEGKVVASDELLTLKLRYKAPDGDSSKLLEFPTTDAGTSYAKASPDFKFAASVAAFGMILRDSPHKGTATLDGVIELADEGKGADANGYRAEFIGLVKQVKAMTENK